jgi:hypothetical protein
MSLPVSARGILLVILLSALVTAASATSYIQVFVHPGSGTVCVDDTCQVNVGTLNGYSSVQFQDVTCGMDHTIQVYGTEGYTDYTDTVYMDDECDSVTRRIDLDPIPAESGDIDVYVSPGVGQVCRDDEECEVSSGDNTDTWSVHFSGVSSDELHTITVTAEGYEPVSEKVSVMPGEVSTVEILLVPLAITSADIPAGTLVVLEPLATTRASPTGTMFVFLALVTAGLLAVYRSRFG